MKTPSSHCVSSGTLNSAGSFTVEMCARRYCPGFSRTAVSGTCLTHRSIAQSILRRSAMWCDTVLCESHGCSCVEPACSIRAHFKDIFKTKFSWWLLGHRLYFQTHGNANIQRHCVYTLGQKSILYIGWSRGQVEELVTGSFKIHKNSWISPNYYNLFSGRGFQWNITLGYL